jgi:serine/threonine protein kinase
MNGQKRPWLNSWESIRSLGKSGQGETALVKNISQPAPRGLLKTVRNNKSGQARGRMRMEVTHLGTLSFAGVKVPAVLESNVEQFKDEGIPLYFVMDFIEGDTLEEVVRTKGPLPLETADRMAFDLGATISAAHEMGVFHRDLKPANIMVRK